MDSLSTPAHPRSSSPKPRRPRLLSGIAAFAVVLTAAAGIGAAQAADSPSPLKDPGDYVSTTGDTDFAQSEELAYQFLDERIDGYGSGSQPRLARSYEGGFFATLPGGFVSSFLYDDALMAIAYLGRGEEADVERAKAIGDALLFVQDADEIGDGRTRTSYIPESVANGVAEVASGSSYTGNQAWVGMALTHLYAATGEQKYLDGALRIGNWIQDNTSDTERVPYGYTGGQDADGNSYTFKSSEHNADVVGFFSQLATLTGDSVWTDRADIAAGFLAAMQADDGHLWTGTDTDGTTTNYYPTPEDPQAWSYLATLDDRYKTSLDWTVQNLNATDGVYEGPAFSSADVSKVWFEGAGQLGLALRVENAAEHADYLETILSSTEAAQRLQANGDGKGIVAASSDGLDTGFGDLYYSSLHTGATSWYLLALTGTNPFRLDGEEEPTTEPSTPTTTPTAEPSTPTAEPTTPATEPTTAPTTTPTTEPTAAPTTTPTAEPTTPAAEPSTPATPVTEPTPGPTATNPVASPSPTAVPTAAETPTAAAAPAIALSIGTLRAGGSLTVDGTGFLPGEQVRIELHSTPTVLATVTADADGTVGTTVTVPAATPTGDHSIVLIGISSGREASQALTVTAALQGDDTLAITGGSLVSAIVGGAAGLLLLLGGGILVRRRGARR